MRINEAARQQILQAYSPKGKAGPNQSTDGTSSPNAPADEITISSEGQGLQRMIRAAQQADEVRGEQVQELQTKLRTGGYQIDPQLIANRMLGLSGGDNS
jgi:flagellar biosynthesis anti-sigma factor FlgM